MTPYVRKGEALSTSDPQESQGRDKGRSQQQQGAANKHEGSWKGGKSLLDHEMKHLGPLPDSARGHEQPA